MKCPSCSAAISDDSVFCNRCGYRVAPETTPTFDERLSQLEQQLAAESQKNKTEQRFLERETAENVMARVRRWITLVLYFTAAPAALLFISLAVIFGRADFSLTRIAADAKHSVTSTVEQARSTARETEQIADDALTKSRQVKAEIGQTQDAVAKLKGQVDARSQEVQALGTRVENSNQQVTNLKNTLDAQSQQVHYITNQIQAVKTNEAVTEVISAFPSLGEHMAGSRAGWIDPKHKEPGLTYVVLGLNLTAKPKINSQDMAQAMTVLQSNQYKVFLDFVGLYAGSPTTSSQGIGTPLNENSCLYWATPPIQPPCILYFNEDVGRSALKARDLLKSIQAIPDTHITFVNPNQLNADMQELLRLSHTDMVIVLAATSH